MVAGLEKEKWGRKEESLWSPLFRRSAGKKEKGGRPMSISEKQEGRK